jgi:putative FmdB family regulatory protein
MPTYEYECDNGHYFERVLPVKDYLKPQTCECGAKGNKKISIPRLNLDMQPWDRYISPVSGKPITSYKERKDDMERHGCVDYEPSLKKHITKNMEREEAKLEASIDATVEKEIHAMPARKREKLQSELAAGASCDYLRK